MNNISFVQVGFGFDGSVYLPYAVGTIIAYCQKDPWIKSKYEFSNIIFEREKLETAVEQIKNPYIAAFSCNVWNMEYNKALARLVKKKYPDCIIIFGGHSVDENAGLLEEEDDIDILMFGEGEETFSSLLYHLYSDSISEVENIAYRSNGVIKKTPRKYYEDISEYPSPYLTGVFDEIMQQNPDLDFLAVLETNRGCPYSCAYCDWCSGRKTRFFPMEKITAEINWLSEHKISYCFLRRLKFRHV